MSFSFLFPTTRSDSSVLLRETGRFILNYLEGFICLAHRVEPRLLLPAVLVAYLSKKDWTCALARALSLNAVCALNFVRGQPTSDSPLTCCAGRLRWPPTLLRRPPTYMFYTSSTAVLSACNQPTVMRLPPLSFLHATNLIVMASNLLCRPPT